MKLSIVVVTCCDVIVSSEIDRSMWTTTIGERLNKNTIIELHPETILRLVKIDGILHKYVPDNEEKKDASKDSLAAMTLTRKR
jgi:hypothetical protein